MLNDLIQSCWQKLADNRPNFEQIAQSLASIHKRVSAATAAAATMEAAPAVQRPAAPKHTTADTADTPTNGVQGGARSSPPIPIKVTSAAGGSAIRPIEPDKLAKP